ncbi:MAG: metal-sulfur cluster assembly factor [Candidatus Nanohaloarchaea archaeon]
MVTKEDVREQLKEVIDPELDINIVDLGLVYEIEVEDGDVEILMTLTTPGCPLHGVFDDLVRREVNELEEVDSVDVELTFEPRWSPDEMSEEARDKLGNVPGMQLF